MATTVGPASRITASDAMRQSERIKSTGLYTVTLIVAACSIVYELLCAQSLSLLAANMVKWYSLTIGVFLAAMGVGALLVERLTKRWGTWTTLCYVEIALSAVGALAIPLIYSAHVAHSYLYMHAKLVGSQVVFFGSAFLIISMIGILTGFELPLLIKLGNALSKRVKLTNRVLGVDYLGSLLGAIAFPLLLVPYFGLITIGFGVATLNTMVAIWLGVNSRNQATSCLPRLACVGLVTVILAVGISNLGYIQQYYLKKYYYFRDTTQELSTLFVPMDFFPDVLRTRSAYQEIDIVEDIHRHEGNYLINAYSTKFLEEPDYPFNTVLFLNGDYQVASRHDEIYHEFFAHVPIIRANMVPEEILVLGAGDGLLIKELLKYKQVRSIVHVELDPEMIRLAKTQPELLAMNHGSLMDPRVSITIGDAYQYVRNLDRKFDAIYIDFPDPVDYNLAKLYSSEFFSFVHERLAPGGFAVFDATGISAFSRHDPEGRREMLPFNVWPIYYHTLKKAGFETIVPFISTLGIMNDKAKAMLETNTPQMSEREWKYSNYSAQFASREDYINSYLIRYARTFEQGFIMLKNGPLAEPGDFHDFGVKLHVLNADRYRWSFGFKFDKPMDIDMQKVNSIMRPTLPIIGIRYIRLPSQ
jgi:spermidine synthase